MRDLDFIHSQPPAHRAGPKPELVIALHASGSSARQWRALAERLEPGCRFIALDLHGHGMQPAWQGERAMTLGDEASLVAAELAQARAEHGRRGTQLIGHSYGGAVALKVASLYPELVRSVAVYEPVLFRLLFDDARSVAQTRDAIGLAEVVEFHHAGGDAEGAAQVFFDYWSGSGSWPEPPGRSQGEDRSASARRTSSEPPGRSQGEEQGASARSYFRDLPAARRAAMAQHMHAVLPHFTALFSERWLCAALARLTLPSLVLTGADTVASTRRIGERLLTLMPGARHETLAGMGHMGPITHADIVNERLTSFLQSTTDTRLFPQPGPQPRAPGRFHPPAQETLA